MSLSVARWCRKFAATILVLAGCLPAHAQEQRRGSYMPAAAGTVHAVAAEHGMVVAQEKIAARIGADVLKRGGNAIDAAVATGFAMAVTYPRAGNIGGGGFMVIHSAERHEDVAIDYRETAPAATTQNNFLGADGKPDNASLATPRSPSACPARRRGWRWRWKNTAPANSRWRNCCGPRSSWRATDLSWPTTAPTRCRAGSAVGALAVVGEDLFACRWHFVARGRPAGPDRSRQPRSRRSRTGSARVLPGTGRRKARQGDPRRRRHHDH